MATLLWPCGLANAPALQPFDDQKTDHVSESAVFLLRPGGERLAKFDRKGEAENARVFHGLLAFCCMVM